MRIGHGYDVHKLVEGRDLILGGVKIPYEKGLLGHSDADVLLHVIDLSNPEWQTQAAIVDKLIAELGAEGTPCIRVYNKCDAYLGVLPRENDAVCISARTGEGTQELLGKISEILGRSKHRAFFRIPYSQGALVQLLHTEAAVLSTEYAEDGTVIEAIVKSDLWAKVRAYAEGDKE